MKKQLLFKHCIFLFLAGLLVIGALPKISNAQTGACQDQTIMKSTLRQALGDYKTVKRRFDKIERRVRQTESRISRLQAKIERKTNYCALRLTKLSDKCAARQSLLELKRALYQQKVEDLQFRLDNCQVLEDCDKIQKSLDRYNRRVEAYDRKIDKYNDYCIEREAHISDYCEENIAKKMDYQTRLEERLSEWETLFAEYEPLIQEAAQILAAAEEAYQACYG